jgi:hypothetical protein
MDGLALRVLPVLRTVQEYLGHSIEDMSSTGVSCPGTEFSCGGRMSSYRPEQKMQLFVRAFLNSWSELQ